MHSQLEQPVFPRLRHLLALTLLAAVPLAGACSSTGGGATAPSANARDKDRTKPTQFAILMYERNDAWARLPRAERDILLRKYVLWIKGLESAGIFKHGTPLGRGGARLTTGPRGEPFATPLDPTAETLTGIFIIETPSAAEAERIAATCPALGHGETIHVRPVGHAD